MPQFGASLTDDASSVNYDCNMFIIQATEVHSISQFQYQLFQLVQLNLVFLAYFFQQDLYSIHSIAL
jgi:hypothetical protein